MTPCMFGMNGEKLGNLGMKHYDPEKRNVLNKSG